MKWNDKFSINQKPTVEDMNKHIENSMWQELCEFIEAAYNVMPNMEHSRCSCSPGWNIKYKKKGKAICTLYPDDGFFTCLIAIGAREAQEAELVLSDCTEYTKNLYYAVKPFNGARWLMIEVRSREILDDVKRLAQVRIKA